MRYLLDTCTFLYYLEGSNKLSSEALSVIESDNLIFLSQTSLWEIAIKKTINKLDITEMTSDLERICNDGGIGIIPIKNRYFDKIQSLPFIHSDPFDRLIIATAIEEDLSIITDDGIIKKYDEVKVLY